MHAFFLQRDFFATRFDVDFFATRFEDFFMRENVSRRAVTHTRRDSLAAVAFGKNRGRVSKHLRFAIAIIFCATRCKNPSRP